MAFSGLLDKTCDTARPSVANAALGSKRTFSGSNYLSDVPCRLAQRSSEELSTVSAGTESRVATHRLWVDYGTDLAEKDQVTVGSVTYEVIELDSDVGGAGHHMAALLLEVR